MSIQESANSIKSYGEGSQNNHESEIFEADFDIVPAGSSLTSSGSGLGTKEAIFYSLVLVLVGTLAFGLGRLSQSGQSKTPVVITGGLEAGRKESVPVVENNSTTASTDTQNGEVQGTQDGAVVASRTGKKYHYPWCAGAKQIAEKNKITFSTIDEARAAGYTPATNCKGLK